MADDRPSLVGDLARVTAERDAALKDIENCERDMLRQTEIFDAENDRLRAERDTAQQDAQRWERAFDTAEGMRGVLLKKLATLETLLTRIVEGHGKHRVSVDEIRDELARAEPGPDR